MERILSIETATRACSVAMADEKGVLGEISIFTPQIHAERLIIMINNLLENLKLSYSDLDAVAVSNGPGSFTGLRIGLGAAKGIAFGQNKKLIAVPTLEGIARVICEYVGDDKIIVPILHARANEFYYSSFRLENSDLKMTTNSRVADAAEIATEFSPEALFVGEGVVEFSKNENVRRKFASGQFKDIAASAKGVGLVAREKFKRGEFADLRTSVPMYIKDFIAVKGNSLNKLLEKI